MVRYQAPEVAQLLLVMLVLVPLANMPFDWLSVGVTRGLLRRGAASESSAAPFWLGLLDAGLGLVLLLALAAAMIVTLQCVDIVVRLAGADKDLIDVPNRLLNLGRAPYDPQNWWIYFTLFSTLLPGALNLLIGMISLTTVSFPSHRLYLIRRIRRLRGGTPGRDGTRYGVSIGLGIPVFIGAMGTGLMLWGLYYLLGLAGPPALRLFLGLAAWLEWNLIK